MKKSAKIHDDVIKSIKFFKNKNSSFIATDSYDKSVKIRDLSNENEIVLPCKYYVCNLAYFEIGSKYFITVGGYSLRINVWNLETRSVEFQLESHLGVIWSIITRKSSENELILISGSFNKTIKL